MSLDAALCPIVALDGAFDVSSPSERIAQLKRRAARLRAELLERDPAVCYRSIELVRVPYPTRFGFLGACRVPTPYIHICNRLFIIQTMSDDGLKTILVSPTDVEGNAQTPFFKRLAEQFKVLGPLSQRAQAVMAPVRCTVEQAMKQAGLSPAQVDYITYDHLHTQDLRAWLGPQGLFPRAKLLVQRQEWQTALAPSPPQRDWYCPDGLRGIDPDRVILLDGDVMVGHSVALVRTPGHTEGNHSVVARTPEGLMVTSENGVGPDAYAPQHSKIPGLARYASQTGMEVVLNGNTLERGLDQYMSMILERELAGPSVRDERFYNTVCSSEFDAFWAFPGIKPTFSFGDLSFGALQRAS